MPFQVGNWIKHVSFGTGQITEDKDTFFVIRFVDLGEKNLKKDFVTEAGSRPTPDFKFPDAKGRRKVSSPGSPKKAKAAAFSFEHLLERFLGMYPAGFDDPAFDKDERAYKEVALQTFNESLSEEAMKSLMDAQDFSELARRAKHVATAKINIIFPNELMDLSDALKQPDGQKEFSLALFDVLYGADEKSVRFERYVTALEELGCTSWTVATFFQFLSTRGQDMFMKPMVSQTLAASINFDLKYASRPNWETYRLLNDMAGKIDERLKAAGQVAKDLVDVQSFMYVTWQVTK